MIQITAMRNYRPRGINLFIDDIDLEGGRIGTVHCVEFVKRENLFEEGPPAPITLDDHAAQKLIDDLWDAGLRPSEGSGSAGCLAATQKHLKDMRAIAFNRLMKINVSDLGNEK